MKFSYSTPLCCSIDSDHVVTHTTVVLTDPVKLFSEYFWHTCAYGVKYISMPFDIYFLNYLSMMNEKNLSDKKNPKESANVSFGVVISCEGGPPFVIPIRTS